MKFCIKTRKIGNTPAQNAKNAVCAGVFSFSFLFSQNFMLIIRVEERYLFLRKKFFNLPMTRLKCFQCHIVPRSCLQVAKYILKWREITKIFLNFTPAYTAKIAVYAGAFPIFLVFVQNFTKLYWTDEKYLVWGTIFFNFI